AGAAALGAKVALVERHLMGGDCLNTGCVPSKALLRCAQAAADTRRGTEYGLRLPTPVEVDFPAVMERLRRLRASLAPHDSAQRFAKLGVDVFFGDARFANSDTVDVEGIRLRFARAVIATGAHARIPDVPGLAAAQPFTHETIFNLTQLPRRLAVLGGGPVGCELAQGFARLGAQVTLFHTKSHLLDREDPDAAARVQEAFLAEGIRVRLDTQLEHVDLEPATGERTLHFRQPSGPGSITTDAILVATGRAPNVATLNLDGLGVQYDALRGVHVNDFLQTTHPRIYACGDVCLRWKFTHAADFAARLVIQNALFALGPFGRRRLSSLVMPRATYTDPEIAHTGLDLRELEQRGLATDTYTVPFSAVDRAVTDGETDGFARVHTRHGTDRILGATVVGKHAGDLISELTLAIHAGIGLGRIASTVHPYPTRAEILRKLGDAYQRTRLTPRAKSVLAALLRWRQ
ncbi:MAG: mercuric reductase, partial [Verrucomicrobiales bacterium]|nr:mercuric reductase [Verrucomicrobiales bacterium]